MVYTELLTQPGKIYFIYPNHFNNFFYAFTFIAHVISLLSAMAYNVLRVCEARKGLGERNELHTRLLADPKGKPAKAGEEF